VRGPVEERAEDRSPEGRRRRHRREEGRAGRRGAGERRPREEQGRAGHLVAGAGGSRAEEVPDEAVTSSHPRDVTK